MRTRITITISADLLEQIDDTIDYRTVRNRSQAIETLLRQVVSPQVSTAVVLAGGNLITDPETGELIPKAMVRINGKPVIEHTLLQLKKYDFTRVIICTSSQFSDSIKNAVRQVALGNVKVKYSEETERLGTGGALKKAAKFIPSKPFLLMHGDILTDINLRELVNFFVARQTKAVIAIKPRPGRLSYGRVFLEGSRVIDFKVPDEISPISLINTGIYLFDDSVLNMLPDITTFKIEETLIPDLVQQGEVSGSVFQGIWFDVSEEEAYKEANQRWTQ